MAHRWEQSLVALLAALVLGGCGVTESLSRITNRSDKSEKQRPEKSDTARSGDRMPGYAKQGEGTRPNGPSAAPGLLQRPKHYEQDPVSPEEKASHGVSYDPSVFEMGAYRPDSLENMITSKGFDGLSQQTYAEAGGDFDIDVDRTGQYMVYSTTRYSANPDICIQSVSGRSVSLRTNDPASDMMPKFSPDSKAIAWCSNRYGTWDILMTSIQGTPDTRPQSLANSTEDEIHPSWSHDGKLMSFCRYSAMDGVWQVWVLDMGTRTLSMITEGLFPEFAPVAMQEPDGSPAYGIVFQKHRRRDVPWFSVWTVNVYFGKNGAVELSGAPSEIVSSNDWAAINPNWSPDGKYIVFASVRKSPLAQMEARIYRADDIWTVKVDGTDLTQISAHSSPDWNPCWAPDKTGATGRIYFSSLRNGHPNIWSVKPMIPGMMAAQGLPNQ